MDNEFPQSVEENEAPALRTVNAPEPPGLPPRRLLQCSFCAQPFTGLDMIYTDAGAGVAICHCARCHYVTPVVDRIEVAKYVKHADAWGEMAGALKVMAPSIAFLGVWDLTVAYSTFKKVMENTLRSQQRQSPLYNPFYASGLQKQAAADEEKEVRIAIKEIESFLDLVIPKIVEFSIDAMSPLLTIPG